MAINRQDYESRIVKALNLPSSTFDIQINVKSGHIAVCECKFYLFEEDIKRFERCLTMDLDNPQKERLKRMLDVD